MKNKGGHSFLNFFIRPAVGNKSENLSDRRLIPIIVWAQSILFSVYYLLLEWIFQITKPTFDFRINIGEKVFLLIFCIAVATLLLSFVFMIIFLITRKIISVLRISLINSIIFVFPVLILTVLFMMIMDNFTYTVFHFGVLTVSPLIRITYLLFFLLLSYFIYFSLKKTANNLSTKHLNIANHRQYIFKTMVVILLDIIIIGFQFKPFKSPSSRIIQSSNRSLPSIILITADGLNADHMSVYGYSRKTTPKIDEISENSLIAMNAFPNASDSQGSVISILTGKNPAETSVLYFPDALMGNDAYDHLPGILHDKGYITYQFGDPYFVDANTANLMEGFDYVNNRKSYDTFWNFLNKHLPSHIQLFTRNSFERIDGRIKHLLWLENIQNPGDFLAGKPAYMYDRDKIETIKVLLKNLSKPVFIHLHMLGTHGPKFTITNPVFSKNHVSNENWDTDYYDDSILQFDSYIGDLFQFLNDNNLTNTIIIIGSDHGQIWKSNGRIPLIIHFPNNSNKVRIFSNAQNIDIYPTILDYLGIAYLYKGKGNSLFRDIPETRPIISLGVNTLRVTEQGRITFSPNNMQPPFFQFGYINLVYCDKWFKINLDDTTFVSGRVENSINSCPLGQKIDDGKAIEIMLEFLKGNGFNTSILSEQLKID